MEKEEKDIKISPKYGVNPSVCHCIVCGQEYGIALLGKLKGDKEAPRNIYEGLCQDCKGVVDKGGVMLIEVKDGETGNTPYRTGRIVGVSKDFKKRNNIKESIMYVEETAFEKLFGDVEFK